MHSKRLTVTKNKGDQPWDFFGRNDAKAETPVLWPPHGKSWLIGKNSDAGRDWVQEEKGTTEDEIAGWHHWLNDVSLSELQELVMDREAWRATIHGVCPFYFPGKNTGVGSHFLLQGIFPTQGSNPSLLHLLHWQADSLPPGNPRKPGVNHLGNHSHAKYFFISNVSSQKVPHKGSKRTQHLLKIIDSLATIFNIS